jgi:hypothetical protein
MEWLDGEELGDRVLRGPLTVEEGVEMLRALASALACAHGAGIVHRDLKPSNIFLRHGRTRAPVLLDFGIARQASGASALTATGAMVGTPAYMSPEQVRGERDLGPASDVFSLGSVLYECLTRRSPFAGDSVVAILYAILFEEPPSLRALVHGLPESLAGLFASMLAKDPAGRPRDGASLQRALDALGSLELAGLVGSSAGTLTVGHGAREARASSLEQQLLSVILVAVPGLETSTGDVSAEVGALATLPEDLDARRGALREGLRSLGAQADWLAQDTLVATVGASMSALDQAALAGRCALRARALWPDALVAVAMGRASMLSDRPLGEAVDRAAKLLAERTTLRGEAGSQRVEDREIVVDALSAEFLRERFVVERGADGFALRGERASVDEDRLLCGRPSPCVGREQELGTLEAALAASAEESIAKAVLVTAPPGVGKSRLRREFVRRVRARSEDVTLVVASAELLGAGTPYGMASQVVARVCEMHGVDDPARRRELLEARVGRVVSDPERGRVRDFLSELCRLPSPDPSARLRAARNDPKLMTEQVLRAFTDLLRGESAERPLAIVLEDLHWGDALSVELFDALARELAESPLLLVAFGRPEVRDAFPRLWSGSGRMEIALGGLSRKAGERLIRAARGAGIDRAAIDRILDRADGNALYLEELIRADAEGRGSELPPTLLAMVQARLSRLEPEVRRLLRAGSVFGETFWRGPVAALLERSADPESLDSTLQFLVGTEILERSREGRYPGEVEYAFRHNLVREAVYDLLSPDERRAWHHGAARSLEALGERDPIVLAEHCSRGGALGEAAGLFLQGARASMGSEDLSDALHCVARGLSCEPDAETRGRLLQLRAQMLIWKLQWREAYDAAREAFALLAPSTHPWFSALWNVVTLSGILGDDPELSRACELLLSSSPPREAHLAFVQSASTVVSMYALRARQEPASAFIGKLEEISPEVDPLDLQSHSWIRRVQSDYRRAFALDPWAQARDAADATALMAQSENERERLFFAVFEAHALGELGRTDEGVSLLREVLSRSALRSEAYIGTTARLHLADLLVALGLRDGDPARLNEARELTQAVHDTRGVSDGYKRWCERLLAEISLREGDLEAAERFARAAVTPSAAELRRILSIAVLVRILLRTGAIEEARARADELLAWFSAHGGGGYAEIPTRLAIAEALVATGAEASGRAQIAAARALVTRCAEGIPDESLRARFLSDAPWSVMVRAAEVR